MTKRENFTAILEGRQPEYYGDIMTSLAFVPYAQGTRSGNPWWSATFKDDWGTTYNWAPGAPGPHPSSAEEDLVIKDIEKWQDYVVPPQAKGLDWTEPQRLAAEIDRSEMFVSFFCGGGIFERSHLLMGFENAFLNYMLYEDEMAALLRVIADSKIEQIKEYAEHIKPDAIFYHDDWGSKKNLFLRPELWRKLIKPLHKEVVQTCHDYGILFIHHADCVCQPVVEDMVEMGIDVWQGAIPQNDICEIQRVTKGQLPMVGGIDGPKIDITNITEEEIRAEVRRAIDTYCPGGKFFPSVAYGKLFIEWNNEICMDELEKYGRQWALEHPVG